MCKKLLCLSCFVLVLSLTTVAMSAELLVYYPLDETAGTTVTDASGNGFDGSIGGLESWVEGNFGGGLELTGADFVTLPGELMGLTSYVGSVSLWMNCAAPTSIYTMFWGGDNTTGGGFGAENEMHLHLESEVADIWLGGELSFWAMADPSVHLHSDPTKGEAGSLPINPVLMGDEVWHQVAATWDMDEGMARLYIDGFLISEGAYAGTPFELTNIYLGQMADGGRTYTGLLDDVRLYSDALTPDDVYSIYEGALEAVDARPEAAPMDFVLNQNYPNPFNPTTSISYQLAKNSNVTLAIYNQAGQKVRTLVQGKQSAGLQSVNWDGCDEAGQKVSSGVYLYRLTVDNQVQTKKLMLMK